MGGKKKRIKITSFFKCTKAKLARDLRHYRGRKSIKKIMSSQATQLLPDQVCYVHCNFCNTILAVNIPSNNMLNIVTVRCGHCANLLSVDMGGVVQTDTLQNSQYGVKSQDLHLHSGPISGCSRTVNTVDVGHQRILPNPPPEKRQRVPSAYNKFIKEEIQRIKANNPDISHREAFSAAAKNWAHFPHIHFGLNLDSSSQVNCEEVITAPGGQKSKGLY